MVSARRSLRVKESEGNFSSHDPPRALFSLSLSPSKPVRRREQLVGQFSCCCMKLAREELDSNFFTCVNHQFAGICGEAKPTSKACASQPQFFSALASELHVGANIIWVLINKG